VLIALLLPFFLVSVTPASAGTESEFVSRTNGARTSHGLRAYAVRSDLTSIARRQAARMAAARSLYHNPRLGSEVSNWRAVGENVGRGGSVSSIHSAFMASYEHRANILSGTFTEVGIGTAQGGDGLLYVSEVFRRPMNATYVAPPTRTARRTVTTYRRASRSAPRRPLPHKAAKKAAVPHLPSATALLRVRIDRAWLAYRRARPAGSMDHVMTYYRAAQLIVGPVPVYHAPPRTPAQNPART
jgi:hypothetical protein